jgi:hypothetical protein
MADIIDLKGKTKFPIANQYPTLHGSDVPTPYEIKPIDTRKRDFEECDVIFWHLLLRDIYCEPLEMECALLTKGQDIGTAQTAIFRRLEEKSKWQILSVAEETVLKLQSGEITPLPINWKYFISLPSGGIIEIGTKDYHSVFYLAHIVRSGQQENDNKEAEQFINLLLAEANRLKNQLFNPLKKFEKADGLKLYHLFNVYLSNYVSATFMHNIALSQEENLRTEFLRYDALTELHEQGKKEHFDQFMLTCGMFFSSAITYFFMALEGFINIVFHAFLKRDLRDKDLNIEQRFDIEQKLRLMPALCSGFKEEYVGATSEIYSNFLKLKKYRNSIFHSKVEESLKSFVFIEDGFMYNVDLSKYKDQFLPSQKIKLADVDVIEVQRIVDEIIAMVLNSMTESNKELTEKYILKSAVIPFYVLDNGASSLGKSDREQNEINLAQQKNQPDRE